MSGVQSGSDNDEVFDIDNDEPVVLTHRRSKIEGSISLDDPVFRDIPEEVMKVLELCDLAGNRELSIAELEGDIQMLSHLRAAADVDGSGDISVPEVQAAIDLIGRLMKARAADAGDMEYTHMPESIKEVLRTWDLDESGVISKSELQGAAKAWKKMQQEGRMMKMLLVAAAAVMLLMFAGMFAMGMVTAELAKEFVVDSSSPAMVTRDGTVVMVGSADFFVDSTGAMVPQTAANQRRLQCEADGGSSDDCRRLGGASPEMPQFLSTAQVLIRADISAMTSAEWLSGLRTVILSLGGEASADFQVAGASSLPAKGTRCWQHVVLITASGGEVTLIDDSVFLSPSFEHVASVQQIMEDSVRTDSGHIMLNASVYVEGLFIKLPGPPPPSCDGEAQPPEILDVVGGSTEPLEVNDTNDTNATVINTTGMMDAQISGKYLILEGTVRAGCYGCTAGTARRELLISPDRTFLVDGGSGRERVVVLDRPTGAVTLFERRVDEHGQPSDPLYCTVLEAAAPGEAGLVWTLNRSLIDSGGPQSFWSGRVHGMGDPVVEIGVDLQTGLVRRMRGFGPFSDAAFTMSSSVDREAFVEKLTDRSLRSWRDCLEAGLAEESLLGMAAGTRVTPMAFELEEDDEWRDRKYEALLSEQVDFTGGTGGGAPLEFDMGGTGGGAALPGHDGSSNSSGDADVSAMCPDDGCVGYLLEAVNLSVCVERKNASESGCEFSATASVHVDGVGATMLVHGVEVSVLGGYAESFVNGDELVSMASLSLQVEVSPKSYTHGDFYIELPALRATVLMPIERQKPGAELKMWGVASGGARSVVAALSGFVPVSVVGHVGLGGRVGGDMKVIHTARAFVDLGAMGILDGEFGHNFFSTWPAQAGEDWQAWDRRLVEEDRETWDAWAQRMFDDETQDGWYGHELLPPREHGAMEEEELERFRRLQGGGGGGGDTELTMDYDTWREQSGDYSEDEDEPDDAEVTSINGSQPPAAPDSAKAERMLAAAQLIDSLVSGGAALPGCSAACTDECDLEFQCSSTSCQTAEPWCGALASLSNETGAWVSLQALLAVLEDIAAGLDAEKQPVATEAAAQVMAVFQSTSTAIELLPIDGAQRYLDGALLTHNGTTEDEWIQSQTSALSFAEYHLTRDLVRSTDKLPRKTMSFPGIAATVLTSTDVQRLLAMSLMEADDNAKTQNLANQVISGVSFNSTTLQVSLDERLIGAKVEGLSASLSFGDCLHVLLDAEALTLDISDATGDDVSPADAATTPTTAMRKLVAMEARVENSGDSGDQEVSISSADDGLVMTIVNSTALSVQGSMGSCALPGWAGLGSAIVKGLTWSGGENSTLLASFESEYPERVNHTFIEWFKISGDVVFENNASGVQPAVVAIDWVNVSVGFDGEQMNIDMKIDGEDYSDDGEGFPMMRISLNKDDAPNVHKKVVFHALRALDVSDSLASQAFSAQTTFDWNLANPEEPPHNASIDDVTLVLRRNVYQRAWEQKQTAGTASSQYLPAGAVVVIDRLAIELADYSPPGLNATGLYTHVPQDADVEIRNLFGMGINMPVTDVEQGEYIHGETTGPEDLPPISVRRTLSKHIARRLCFQGDEHDFNFQRLSATVPLGSNRLAGNVSLNLHDVSWSPHSKTSAFPMFGNISIFFPRVQLRLPGSVFYKQVPKVSQFGGDAVLDSEQLEVHVEDPELDLPRLDVTGLPLATDAAGPDDIYRRLRRLQGGGAGGQPLVSVQGSKGQVPGAADCPALEFRANAMPIFGSRLLRRRVGKVAFKKQEGCKLPADQGISIAGIQEATLHVRIREPLKMDFFMRGLTDGEFNSESYVELDPDNTFDATVRRVRRRLQAVEQEGRRLQSEELAVSAEDIREKGLDYPVVGPHLHEAAALVASRRLQGSNASANTTHEWCMGASYLPPTVGFSTMLDFQEKRTDGTTAPEYHVVYDWIDLVSVFGFEAETAGETDETRRLRTQVRRLAAREAAALERPDAVVGRRLQASTPLMISDLATDTCEMMDCEGFDEKWKCEAAAAKLGLEKTSATDVPAGPERNKAPPGCFWANDGALTGLYWNENFDSPGKAGFNERRGTQHPICDCLAGKCPLPMQSKGPLAAMEEDDFECSGSGDDLPQLPHELTLDDLWGKRGTKAPGEIPFLPTKDFDEKCTAATREPEYDDPLNWGSATVRPTGTACYAVEATGVLSALGKFQLLVHNVGGTGVYEMVSSVVKVANLAIPGILALKTAKGRLMFSTAGTGQLTFITDVQIPTVNLLGSLGDLFPSLVPSTSGTSSATHMLVPLLPGKATIKMQQDIDTFGAYNFKHLHAAVGFNPAIPVDWWPKAFKAAPTLFVNVGTDPDWHLQGASASITAQDATIHMYARTGAPYGCVNVKVPEISSAGYGKLTFGNSTDDAWPVLDLAQSTLTGKMDVVVPKDTFGTNEDMKIQTRYIVDKAAGELTMDGFTNAPVKWKVPELGAELELNVMSSFAGPMDGMNGSSLALRVKGCGFGELPFQLGSSRPSFLAQADFSGSKMDGFEWQVDAGLENIKIDGFLKEASILVGFGTAGLQVIGTAKAELALRGVAEKPDAVLQLEYKEGRMRAKGELSMPITPNDWKMPAALVRVAYDSEATPKLYAEAEVTGTFRVGALFPGAPTAITVEAVASSEKSLDVSGAFTITLPDAVDNIQLDCELKLSNEAGITAQCPAHNLGRKLVDMPTALAERGFGDIMLDSVLAVAVAPWKDGSPKSALWVRGKVGGGDNAVEGLVLFSATPCFVLTTSPDAAKSVLGAIGVSSGLEDPMTVAFCGDPKLIEDIELPPISIVAGVGGDLEIKEAATDSTAIVSSSGEKAKTPSSFRQSLPALSPGFSIVLPITVPKGSVADMGLKFMGIPSRKFEMSLGYDFEAKQGSIGIKFENMEWQASGAIEEAKLSLEFEAAIAKKMALPRVVIGLDLSMRMDGQGGLLKFKGELGVSSEAVAGKLSLYSPSVIRVISKRIAVITRPSVPTELTVNFHRDTGTAELEMMTGVILDAHKDVHTSFLPSKGQELYEACNKACIVADFKVALTIRTADKPVSTSIDYLKTRFQGEFSVANLYQAISGATLPSAMRGAMNKWLGVSTLGVFEYDPGSMLVKSALVSEMQGVGLMSGFEASLGVGSLNLNMGVGISTGCLGIGGASSCTGVLMEAPASSQRINKNTQQYNRLKGMIQEIGWPGENIDPYMPAALDSPAKLSSYATFKLSQRGIALDIYAKARMSTSFVDVGQFLPSLDINIQYAKGSLAVSAIVPFGAIASMGVSFGMFVGSVSHSGSGIKVTPPRFNYLKFDIQTGNFISHVKNMVKNAVSAGIWWFLDTFVLNWFSVNYIKAGITTSSGSFGAMITLVGAPIKFDATVQFGVIQHVLKGNWGAIASEAVNSIRNGAPDACGERDVGRRRRFQEQARMTTHVGAYKQTYGAHSVHCGVYWHGNRVCGHHPWCGVSCGWWCSVPWLYWSCGWHGWSWRCSSYWGRKSSYCCRTNYCCKTFWTLKSKSCYYVYWSFGVQDYYEITNYAPTYSTCAGYFFGKSYLTHTTSRSSFRDYKLHHSYRHDTKWNSYRRRTGWCNNWGWCPTR